MGSNEEAFDLANELNIPMTGMKKTGRQTSNIRLESEIDTWLAFCENIEKRGMLCV